MYVHEHVYKYLYDRVYTRSEHCMNEIHVFSVVYTCLYMVCTWHKLGCTFDTHVCTCFILVHTKNMENLFTTDYLHYYARLYSPCNMYVLCYHTGISQ
jgi:hypothetical protein